MSDWQPVRIRPDVGEVHNCLQTAGHPERIPLAAGKIVRARPCQSTCPSTTTWQRCDGQMYEIHPLDHAQILKLPPEAGDLVCEHMILAD